jgi:hypothetical protein
MKLVAGRLLAFTSFTDGHDEDAEYVAYEDATHYEEAHAGSAASPNMVVESVAVAPSRAIAPTVIPVQPAAFKTSAQDGVPALESVIESRAHASGVLISPEALAEVVRFSSDRAETLQRFGDILNQAVRTLPREDGWILLSSDRLATLSGSAKKGTVHPEALQEVASAEAVSPHASERIVRAVLSGMRDDAFSLLRDLEQHGASAMKVTTDIIAALDQVYKSKTGNTGSSLGLAQHAGDVSSERIHALMALFAGVLETSYALPYTGLKIGLAQAFDA